MNFGKAAATNPTINDIYTNVETVRKVANILRKEFDLDVSDEGSTAIPKGRASFIERGWILTKQHFPGLTEAGLGGVSTECIVTGCWLKDRFAVANEHKKGKRVENRKRKLENKDAAEEEKKSQREYVAKKREADKDGTSEFVSSGSALRAN